MAFKIPDGQEVKDFGFTVYDAEKGDPIEANPNTPEPWNYKFVIDEMGNLYVAQIVGKSFPKDGSKIIQFASTGRYMRY